MLDLPQEFGTEIERQEERTIRGDSEVFKGKTVFSCLEINTFVLAGVKGYIQGK